MQVVFEEDGVFKAGSVMTESAGGLQIETHTGKRTKVKVGHVMLRFAAPSAAQIMQDASELAASIDLDLIWECAPADEFGFEDLAKEYFGGSPSATEQFALLIRIHASPMYFYRKGRGRYRSASADTLKAALAAVEKKKLQQEQMNTWAHELATGHCPAVFRPVAATLLVAPDKNGIHYKTLLQACDQAQLSAEQLLLKAGAFKSPYDLHMRKFVAEYFATGLAAKASELSAVPDDLPLSQAQAFSIDDSSTTEIDDCLSVHFLNSEQVRVGVHIAAPSCAITIDSSLDLAARERMSTVYMPGDKVTMLADEVVQQFSLDAGRTVPALSLYLDVNLIDKTVGPVKSCFERITVAANLRHDKLDEQVTAEALESDLSTDNAIAFAFHRELAALWKVTAILGAQRDLVRGKPEGRNRADFNFRIYADSDAQPSDETHATQTIRVEISERQRNAPLDRIVAEMMILANNQWGLLLANHLTPGIYRSQQMGKVKMLTYPQPHQGLGVTHYGWFTSPLRRYTDLINQRQLLAVLGGTSAPYEPNDARLHAIIAAFDARYSAYADFQSKMEKYWCLKWVEQSMVDASQGDALRKAHPQRFEAVVVKDDLVRLLRAPLYIRMADLAGASPGREITVDLSAINTIELSIQARFIELKAELSGQAEDLISDQDLGQGALPNPSDNQPSADEPAVTT